MKGFVPTPVTLVDAMVEKLFCDHRPGPGATLLDPGCGSGAFIEGVIRWCRRNGTPVPKITGVDSDPARLREAATLVGDVEQLTLLRRDFLTRSDDRFDYVIGNPPYVPITGLDLAERTRYRESYLSATGRFDLYLLFFEQALRLLTDDGRLVFVTPEKFLYVQSAAALRRLLAESGIEEIELIEEASFPGLVTYPAITTIDRRRTGGAARVVTRDGSIHSALLDRSGRSWLPAIHTADQTDSPHTFADAFLRISCGVATGADSVFVMRDEEVPVELRRFAYPTLSGRGLTYGQSPQPKHQMLIPYAPNGELLSESELGPLRDYLADPARTGQLLSRTCVVRKPWYAFHENPVLEQICRPKILCKDISPRPWFVVDETGDIVPRHSLYYLVPEDQSMIHELCQYLNSDLASEYLMSHCQRAANGFIRLQSHVLKGVPLPERWAAREQLVGV